MASTFQTPCATSRFGLGVVGLLGFATWALSHSYRGIFHDAGLYTLQALADLHPESLPEDVFLKFGSQDRFTIFSPIFASASRLLGVEAAAATLTLLLQGALLAGAWALARTVMPLSMTVLGVAVLIAVPGDYGADRIFTCIEPFLTPRMAAEALVLCSLAAALRQRRALAVLFGIAAALLHPIMALAGVCALLALYVGKPKPLFAGAMALVGIAALALAAFIMPLGEWGRFDAAWLALVDNRSPYLFIAHWQLDDWSRSAVTAATLGVGLRVLPNERARILSLIALATALTGLALTFIASDCLHLVVFTQLQPWRWQWLGIVVAALLLPEILRHLWRNDAIEQRTAGFLLISAWVFASNVYALFASAAALAALLLLQRLKPSEARWVFFGACALLAIAVAWRLASNLQFTEAYYQDSSIPLWLRRTVSFTHDGTAPIAAVVLAFWLGRLQRGPAALTLLGGLAAAGCGVTFAHTWTSWTAREFPAQQLARYGSFRERIPSGANVFWPESPVAVWVLLNRPSYLSVIQTSGMVFSRRTALELSRRAEALSGAINPASFMSWNAGTAMSLTQQQLQRVCGTGEFQFLVTTFDLGMDPVAEVPAAGDAASKKIRLYRCPAPAAAQALAAAAST